MRFHSCRFTMAVFCLVAGSGAVSASVHHKPPTYAKATFDPNYKYIKSAYDYRSFGYVKRDCNQIYSYTTPDYWETNLKGHKSDKAECLKHIYNEFAILGRRESEVRADFQSRGGKEISCTLIHKFTINRLSVQGNVVTVIETDTLSSDMRGVTADNKAHAESMHVAPEICRDVWVRASQGWLQQSSTQLK